MQGLVREILDKKDGNNEKQWADITRDYDLECSPEVLRKLSAGIKFADDAGMAFTLQDQQGIDKNFVERQKLYDIQKKIRKDMREISRSELICESIEKAIASLPEIKINSKLPEHGTFKRDVVLGIGDFHYGADYQVTGLYGEIINKYNSSVFEKRMEELLSKIREIVYKESPEQLTILIAGDMLDGLLRTSQLQRLEYGVIESAMKLSEFLTQWLVSLEEKIIIPIRVYSVRGNHGEIRPLGTKAGQFPEENIERMIMHYLFARFKNNEYVKIMYNDAPMVQIVDVYGYRILLTHGQDSNIESMAKDCVNLYGKSIDMFMVGHLHKSQSFVSGIMPESNIRVERIPSICGIDPYAQSKGYGALPGATVILVEKDYGVKCLYPVVLK